MARQKKSTKARQLNKTKKHKPRKKMEYLPDFMMFSNGVERIFLRDVAEREYNMMENPCNEQKNKSNRGTASDTR